MPDNKNCSQCPSFLTPQETLQRLGRSTGAPMCALFGTILGKPNHSDSQNIKLRREVAEACGAYGEPRPTGGTPSPAVVMLPDPELRDLDKIDRLKKDSCTSCNMCSNFIQESAVVNETGWSAGLCAARGKLILSTRMTEEATDCDYRQFGQTRSSIGNPQFLPHYADDFGTAVVTPAKILKDREEFVDPSVYPTDKEVTAGEEAGGIRAWRRIEDPEGTGNAIYFPVYDVNFFDDDQRALVPKTGGDEHPELYVDHFGGLYGLGVAWMELDETPVFWGMAGVGKTELLRYAAWLMQLPFHRISFTATSEVDHIIGTKEFTPEKGTYFRYGRLPQAWQQPGVLCLDEPNVAPPEVWQEVRPLTDNSKQLVIDQGDNPVPLDRHDDCYMGMAMNPAWDPRNIGALEIADADSNRLFHTYIDMPPEVVEREIIQARVKLDGWQLAEAQLDSLIETAKSLRKLSDEQKIPVTWAIRPQIKVARALRWFSPTTAYRRAVGDALEPAALQVLLDQVRAHFTEE